MAIEPGDLARHARRLADEADAAGPPLTAVAVRRSISASYYAVFHAVALGLARHLAPGSADDARFLLARSVDHGRLADVSLWVTTDVGGRTQSAPVVARLRGSPSLRAFAALVRGLRDARQDADYDHLVVLTAADAVQAHRDAVDALALLDELAGTPELGEFYALVALHSTLR